MFFRPKRAETGEMWDTWLYWHTGTYYLYYLARSGEKWDNISMAISKNGVDWEEIGPILNKREEVTWMGTGSTWKDPDPSVTSRFLMNFSEWNGPRQTIFLAQSDDLIHWDRMGTEIEFVQDERWYEPLGRWDCIWTIPRPEGGLYGYWTASPKPETSGRFGFGQSLDGVKWEALPPPQVNGAGEGEVGAIEKVGDCYYMMFGSYGIGMQTLTADKVEGPFQVALKNKLLLGGHCYFSRFFPSPDGLLVNHHSITRDGHIFMGLLKRAVVDPEGTLRLSWWGGNEQLKVKRNKIEIPVSVDLADAVSMLDSRYNSAEGMILEGTIKLPSSMYEARKGLFIEYGLDQGMAILLDSQGRAEICQLNHSGSNSKMDLKVDREMDFAVLAKCRLVLQNSLAEFYLDEVLIECFSLPQAATGQIGLIPGGDAQAFSDLVVWQ
jgi:hypothetical protein